MLPLDSCSGIPSPDPWEPSDVPASPLVNFGQQTATTDCAVLMYAAFLIVPVKEWPLPMVGSLACHPSPVLCQAVMESPAHFESAILLDLQGAIAAVC